MDDPVSARRSGARRFPFTEAGITGDGMELRGDEAGTTGTGEEVTGEEVGDEGLTLSMVGLNVDSAQRVVRFSVLGLLPLLMASGSGEVRSGTI